MEKRRISFSIFTGGLALSLWTITSCSQLQTREEIAAQIQEESKKPVSNPATSTGSVPETTTVIGGTAGAGPATKEKKVAIILGPGGYKAFAHTGVIKELRKQNIPIHKIVGIEWGALVAGLYAQRGQINEAEWKLYKLEKLDLDSSGFFGGKKEVQPLKVLDDYLKENLEAKDITQAAVPFFCPSLMLNTGTLAWQDSGTIVSCVRNCMAFPPLFSTTQPNVAGAFSTTEATNRLKAEGFNVIIFVNVLGDGNFFDNTDEKDEYATTILWNEVRRSVWQAKGHVTDVIDVPTRGISLGDFSARKDLGMAGEAAGEKAARAIADKYGF